MDEVAAAVVEALAGDERGVRDLLYGLGELRVHEGPVLMMPVLPHVAGEEARQLAGDERDARRAEVLPEARHHRDEAGGVGLRVRDVVGVEAALMPQDALQPAVLHGGAGALDGGVVEIAAGAPAL